MLGQPLAFPKKSIRAIASNCNPFFGRGDDFVRVSFAGREKRRNERYTK
jgi:hypothetical protein